MNKQLRTFLYSLFFVFALVTFDAHADFPFLGFFEKIENFFHPKEKEQITQEFPAHENMTINLKGVNGSITVRSWKQKIISLEAVKIAQKKDIHNVEIVTDKTEKSLKIETKHNTANLRETVNYTIIVPENSNLNMKTLNGNIKIKDVHGKIAAETFNGGIEITNTKQTVLAKTKNGSIKAHISDIAVTDKCVLESNNGNILLTIPREIDATLMAKTDIGSITSDREITLDPYRMKLNKKTFNKFKKNTKGKLGKGGAHIILHTNVGNIKIRG